MFGIGYAGAGAPSTFYSVDPMSGSAVPIGPVGFNRCSGLDVGPGDVLYATCENTPASVFGEGSGSVLITIDPMTGAGTLVGPTGLNAEVSDISFRSDGTLFAYDANNDPEHTLATIDTSTGAGTIIGDTGLSTASGNGMAFDASDVLFQSQLETAPDPELNTLNTSTGMATFVTETSLPVQCTNFCRFNAMDVDPTSGIMYGVLNDGAGGGAGPKYLTTINTTTGVVSMVGTTANDLDAIAFMAFVPVELQSLSVE